MTVLFVNDFESRCGHCGKGAFPSELVHDTLAPGYGHRLPPGVQLSGCGRTFTAVSSDYVGDTMALAVMSLRPDLPFIDPLKAPR